MTQAFGRGRAGYRIIVQSMPVAADLYRSVADRKDDILVVVEAEPVQAGFGSRARQFKFPVGSPDGINDRDLINPQFLQQYGLLRHPFDVSGDRKLMLISCASRKKYSNDNNQYL